MIVFVLLLNLFTAYIPLVLLGMFLPYFSKSTLFFGVNIPEEVREKEELVKIKKDYVRNYSISSILAIALIMVVGVKLDSVAILTSGIFVIIILLSTHYFLVHRKVKALKAQEGWIVNKKQVIVVDTSNRRKDNKLPIKWFWIPFSILLFTWIFTMIQFPHLPEQIPGHFNFQGQVTRYSDTSFFTAFTIPLSQLGMTAMMYYFFRMMGSMKMVINPAKPKTSSKQHEIYIYRWSVFLVLMSSILNIHFAYIQLTVLQVIQASPLQSMVMNAGLIVFPMLAILYLAINTGQGGSRIPIEEEEETNPKLIQRDDDQYWKLGMLYYNPDDPSLWIEKRFGIGWTINHAHPVGMVMTVGTILLILSSIVAPFIVG